MFLAYIRYSSRETATLFNSVSLVGKLKGSIIDFQLNCKSVSSFPVLQHTYPVSEDKRYKGVFRLGAGMSSPISVTLQLHSHLKPPQARWLLTAHLAPHGAKTQVHMAHKPIKQNRPHQLRTALVQPLALHTTAFCLGARNGAAMRVNTTRLVQLHGTGHKFHTGLWDVSSWKIWGCNLKHLNYRLTLTATLDRVVLQCHWPKDSSKCNKVSDKKNLVYLWEDPVQLIIILHSTLYSLTTT